MAKFKVVYYFYLLRIEEMVNQGNDYLYIHKALRIRAEFFQRLFSVLGGVLCGWSKIVH